MGFSYVSSLRLFLPNNIAQQYSPVELDPSPGGDDPLRLLLVGRLVVVGEGHRFAYHGDDGTRVADITWKRPEY